MIRTLFACCVLLGVLEFGWPAPADDSAASPKPVAVKSPLSPEESLKHLVLADPNLVIEIAAAEPEVIDPVSIQFDEHGRLWVVEMRDYPTGPQNAPPPLGGPDAKPLSRIKLLEDKDGDGRFETAHVFADNLLFATGVQPWDGGVIVTLAGEVAYFKDTDGDHKADLRETWFTGFSQMNTQLRANHPTFGPDGWIYIANGLRGGNVIAVKKDWPVAVRSPDAHVRTDDVSKQNEKSNRSDVGVRATGVSHDPANPVPVSLTGRDFKFDPLTGRYEAISGNGQFGMTFDAWGNRFVCDNRHPCRHVIFEEDFIRRCPHVAFPAVVNDVIPPDDKNKVFPLTSAWTTSNLHAGTFTASCGVCVYTGDWLPEEFRGNVFVCEPTGNLVQRAVLEPDGVTFKSRNPYAPNDATNNTTRRAGGVSPPVNPNATDSPTTTGGLTPPARQENRGSFEFLASRDDWFRPVDLQNGPDGALYVVDMYRAVIEHPEWVPDELKNRPDTWLGNDKGRIYRIRPRSPVAPRQGLPNASPTSPKESTFNAQSTSRAESRSRSDRATLGRPLVSIANLDSSFISKNGWHRMTAARIRRENPSRIANFHPDVWSNHHALSLALQLDPESVASNHVVVLSLLLNPNGMTRDLPRLASHSPWSASSRRGLIQLALRDEREQVRFQGLIQTVLTGIEISPCCYGINERLMIDAHDPWARFAYVAALTLRDPSKQYGPEVDAGANALAKLTQQHSSDFFWWTGTPISSLLSDWDGMPQHWNSRGIAEAAFLLGEVIGGQVKSPDDDALGFYLLEVKEVSKAPQLVRVAVKANAVLGVAKGLARKGKNLQQLAQVEKSKDIQNALDDATLEAERLLALPKSLESAETRSSVLAALRVVRNGNHSRVAPWLKSLAEETADQELRLTALESFAAFQDAEVQTWLLSRYSAETPAIRRAILSALLASKERQLALLGAIAEGKIAATEIDPVRAKQLTEAKDEAVREKARQVLAAAAPASRKEVLEAYQPALTLKGDAARGREVFQKNCVTCHKIGDLGVNVAPDISDTRTKKPEQLLLDILDPNRAIDANYFAYAVVTKDGKTESGVIASESSNSITLKQPEGKVLTLLRSDIDELRNTGISLMPVGVEKNINQQQMADLIFWLKNWRYLDGKVPATSLK